LIFVFSTKESSDKERKISGGGAIIVGPFPVVFGTDKESIKTVLLLSITLSILLVVAMIMSYLISR